MDSEQGIELGIQNVAMEDIVLNDHKEKEQEKEKQLEEAKMNEKMQEVEEEVKDKNKDNNNVGQDLDEGGNTHEDTNTTNGEVAGNHANLGYDTAFWQPRISLMFIRLGSFINEAATTKKTNST